MTWTGGGANNLLSNGDNWDAADGKGPIGNDTLLINNGDTVAHNNNLAFNTTINLVGSELTTDGAVIRLNNATINVDAASTLSGLLGSRWCEHRLRGRGSGHDDQLGTEGSQLLYL